MGISGFLAGLARAAGAAAPYAANTLAAKARAQAEGTAQRRQELLQLLAMQRQERAAAARDALSQAQTGYYNQRAHAAERVPVTYKAGDNSEYYALPTSLSPDERSSSGGAQGLLEQRFTTPEPSPTLERQREQRAPFAQSAQQPAHPFGIPTGVHAPPPRQPAPRSATGMVNGRAVVGTVSPNALFSPDTTASGDTVLARPRAGRNGSGGSGSTSAELQRTISDVRAQITDSQRQRAGLDATVRAGREPFATPEAKQASTAAVVRQRQLDTRLDSLRAVYDRLIREQQRLSGFANVGGSPASVGGESAGAGSVQLSAEQQRAIQAEFDAASTDLQAVLSSPRASDAIKRQARELYNQRQLEIARKYSAIRR